VFGHGGRRYFNPPSERRRLRSVVLTIARLRLTWPLELDGGKNLRGR